MSDSQILKTLYKYGSEIISPEHGKAIIEPELDITPSQILELLEKINGDEDSAEEVGILNILPHLVNKNIEKFEDMQLEQLKEKYTKLFKVKMNKKSKPKFADACVNLYVLKDGKWNELIDDLVFGEACEEINGLVLIRLMLKMSQELINQKLSKIVKLVSILLSRDDTSISVKTGLIVVLSRIDTKAAFEEDKDLIEILWKSVLYIFQEEPDRIQFIVPVLEDIFENVSEILDDDSKVLSNAIEGIENIEQAKPLLSIIFLLNKSLIISFLRKIQKLADIEIMKTNKLPEVVITALDDAPLDKIKPDIIKEIVVYLNSVVNEPSGLAVYAPFGANILCEIPEGSLFELVVKCLNEEPIKVTLGLKIFELLSNYSDDLDVELPDKVMFQFIDLLTDKNEGIRKATYKTFFTLISNNVFIHDDQIQKFFPVFQKVPQSDVYLYFKLLRNTLRVEGLDDSVVLHIFKFTMEIINKEPSPELAAQCLSVICAIASQDGDELVYQFLETLIPIALDLMNSDLISTYTFASRSLVLFASFAPDALKRPVINLFPRLFKIAYGEVNTNPKIQSNIAIAIASLAICLDMNKEFPKVVELIDKFVQSKENHLVTAAGAIAEVMRSCDNQDLMIQIFRSLSAVAIKTDSREQLNALLDALRKIIKKYPVPLDDIIPIVSSFISGSHPIFEHKPPALLNDKDTKIYHFLQNVAENNQELLKDIADFVINTLTNVPMYMYDVYLDIISFISNYPEIIDSKFLINFLINKITGKQKEIDEILLSIVLNLLPANRSAIDIEKFTNKLLAFYSESNETSSGWFIELCSTILELSAMGENVEVDVIKNILSFYPFDPEFGRSNSMSNSLITMAKDESKRWESIEIDIAKSFIKILLLKQEVLAEHQLEKDTITEMKNMIKTTLRKHNGLEREITKGFGKNRQMQNRFKSLLK